jgi:hypothetical protein
MRFRRTLLVKDDDLYSIRLFNDRSIDASSWRRRLNIDWVELILDGKFIILLFMLYCPWPWNCQIWANVKQGGTNSFFNSFIFL